MPRKTVIDRLPKEIREKIGELRNQGRTIDEILAKLRELDVVVARSTLGYHIKKFDQFAERVRVSRAIADAVVPNRGESKQLRLNVELTHTAIMELFSAEDGSSVMLDPEKAMFLARSLRDLAVAAKTDAEHMRKVREELAKEAAAVVKGAAKKAGLSAEAIAAIERDVLGIARDG